LSTNLPFQIIYIRIVLSHQLAHIKIKGEESKEEGKTGSFSFTTIFTRIVYSIDDNIFHQSVNIKNE
jgi:hypothetical protein